MDEDLTPTLRTLNPGLDARLRQSADHFGIPGLAVALVGAESQAVLLHGCTSGDQPRPVDAHTWFSVASLGKHVTALMVLMLAQEGRIKLDAPISKWLDDLPAMWQNRSVSSLIHHTSGLPEYLSPEPGRSPPTERADFLHRYSDLMPAFEEGQAWMYSNTNYILLGFLISEVTGKTYAAALHDAFGRLGCRGVSVASPQWARGNPPRSTSPLSVMDLDSMSRSVIGDGDVAFTATGAVHWMQLLLGLTSPIGGHGMPPHEAMWTPPILRSGRPCPYGAGWFLEPLGENWIVHHAGHFDGWTAMCILNPKLQAGVMAMSNHAPGNTRAIRHLAQLALEGFCPGSTALSLRSPQTARGLAGQMAVDGQSSRRSEFRDLTEHIRNQIIRAPDQSLCQEILAEELRAVARHGSPVRTVPNLHTDPPALSFEQVSEHHGNAHRFQRYRLTHQDRIEHILIGLTPQDRIYWAWGC